MGEEALFRRKKEMMKSIFIVRDEFNHGSKWEVVIGTEKHHCKDENEVIALIHRALNEKSFAAAEEISAAQDERILAQEGDWGD